MKKAEKNEIGTIDEKKSAKLRLFIVHAYKRTLFRNPA